MPSCAPSGYGAHAAFLATCCNSISTRGNRLHHRCPRRLRCTWGHSITRLLDPRRRFWTRGFRRCALAPWLATSTTLEAPLLGNNCTGAPNSARLLLPERCSSAWSSESSSRAYRSLKKSVVPHPALRPLAWYAANYLESFRPTIADLREPLLQLPRCYRPRNIPTLSMRWARIFFSNASGVTAFPRSFDSNRAICSSVVIACNKKATLRSPSPAV
jgi:hypothetical protein